MHHFLEQTLAKCELTLQDCETFLFCLQKPLKFNDFKQLVSPRSRDFIQILEERSAARHKKLSKQMYEGQETYGKLVAEAAERKLRDETYG